MTKGAKIWLIVAASLVILGALIFGGAMTMLNWNFLNLSTTQLETNNHEITEKIDSISITTNTADIELVVTNDEKCSVVCHEQKKIIHSVKVEDGTLTIKVEDTRKWYEYIGIGFGSTKITVNIPKGEYEKLKVESDTGSVNIPKELKFTSIDITEDTGHVRCYASASEKIKIKTDTGNILVENVSTGALDLSVSTGRIDVNGSRCTESVNIKVSTGKANVKDTTCKSLISSGSTGDLLLSGVIAADKISIERSTGDIRFNACDAAEINVVTDTGDVTGSLLSEKVFIPRSDTGSIRVPETKNGGFCKITTDTGDIKITLVK